MTHFLKLIAISICVSACREAAEKQQISDSTNASERRQSGVRDTNVERLEEALLRSHRLGSDELCAHIDQLLKDDEVATLHLLGKMTSEVNYDAIGYALLEHFKNEERLAEGLDAFEILSENITLTAPLLEHFASAYWNQEPEKTLTWLLDHGEMEGIESALHLIGIRSGGSDSREEYLAKTLNSDLSEKARSSYLHGVIREWMIIDFEAAFKFMSHLSGSKIADETVYHMAGKAAVHDSRAAMEWAESISDEGLRQSAVQEVTAVWKKEQPRDFRNWQEVTKSSPPSEQEENEK